MQGALSRTGHILRFPNLVILSQMLLKIGGSNRSSGKSGRNCGKEPSKQRTFPLIRKWLHHPTCHLRLRHFINKISNLAASAAKLPHELPHAAGGRIGVVTFGSTDITSKCATKNLPTWQRSFNERNHHCSDNHRGRHYRCRRNHVVSYEGERP